MFAIELYRKYLYNSTRGISNVDKAKKLDFEKQKITEILDSLPSLFYKDKALIDKCDTTVYTYIKREIISEVIQRGQDAVVFESGFFLRSVLNEIEQMKDSMAA